MTSVPNYIRGSILGGAPFLIVNGSTGSEAALLTLATGGYQWYYPLGEGGTPSPPPLFKAWGTTGGLWFYDVTNSNPVAVDENNTLQVGTAPATLNPTNSFAEWYPPTVLLSGAAYQMGDVTAGGTGGPFYFLPSVWYGDCSGNSAAPCNTNTGVPGADTMATWLCGSVVGPTGSSCSGVMLSGYTTYTDAVANNPYSYCPTGDLCGAGSCKGPCQEAYYDCDYQSSGETYHCQINPYSYLKDVKWWKSPYFIGVVIALLLSMGVIVLLIFLVLRKKSQEKESPTPQG